MPRPAPGSPKCGWRSRQPKRPRSSAAAPGSIEARAGRAFGAALRPARHHLAGLVMGNAPGIILADEQVAGDQRTAVELFLADDERGVAIEQHPLVIAGNTRRRGTCEDAMPAFHHRIAV